VKNVIQSYYNYNEWANDRLFATAAKLAPESWLTQSHAAFGSLRDVMTHIVSCERGWIAYVQGQDIGDLNPKDFESVATLHDAWRRINATTNSYIQSLNDAELERALSWTGTDGEAHDYPQWKMLLHQANHAMQHRSEAALILSELGASTDWMDYLIFVSWIEQPWRNQPS
jgi:uncharacterized damage-inducible protein DinB